MKFFRLFTLLFQKIQKRKILTASLFFAFISLFFVTKNGGNAATVFSFDEMNFFEKIKLSLSVLYDVSNTFPISTFFLLLFISLLQSCILVIFYSYMKERNEAMHVEKASIVISTLLALFGSSCVACGGVALTLLSSFGVFGTSMFLFPFDSVLVLSFVSILLFSILYRLLKKVENPFVC